MMLERDMPVAQEGLSGGVAAPERDDIAAEARRAILLADTALEGVILHDGGTIVEANRALARMFGYELSEVIGRDAIDLLIAATSRASVRRRFEEGCAEAYRAVGRKCDGTLFPIEVEAVKPAGGPPAWRGAAVRDVTEQVAAESTLRRTEIALRATEARFRAVAENATESIVSVDDGGRIIYWNRAAEKDFGWKAADALGRPLTLIIPRRFHRQHEESFGRWARGNGKGLAGRVLELIARRRDDSEFPVELSLGVWETEQGRFATGILRDITERKRAEQLQNELEHANRLSTMGEMAVSLAHELNQPLYAVVNYCGACVQVLEGSGDTRQLAKLLHEVEAQATRAGRIVRRLHEFAQRRGPRRSTCRVNDVIRGTLPLLNADAGAVGASLRLKLADHLPCILADRIELQQVVVNLVHNALEALSRSESGRRDVCIRTTAPDPGTVQVDVTDTGPGLRPGHADEVFEPFYTTKPDGMGMGLAICRRIVAAHGGRLWVREHPDGVTFSFTLPSDPAQGPRPRAADRVRGR